MARGVIQDNVLDTQGNAVVGATVTIYIAGTLTKATLYDASEGGSAIANPVTSGARGAFIAYVTTGEYDLKITTPSGTFYRYNVNALDADVLTDLDANAAAVLAAKNETIAAKDIAVTKAGEAESSATAAAASEVQTGLDVLATAADRVQTGLDVDATAADRVQTGLDATTTGNNVTLTNADVVTTGNNATQTSADVVTTGGHVTAAQEAQTGAEAAETGAEEILQDIEDLFEAALFGAATPKADYDTMVQGQADYVDGQTFYVIDDETNNGRSTYYRYDAAGGQGQIYNLDYRTDTYLFAGFTQIGQANINFIDTPPTASGDDGAPGDVASDDTYFYYYGATQWYRLAGGTF